MKKTCTILYCTLILFFVFACTMPSELEITGSPSIKFAANIDFGDYFSDMVDEIINADSAAKTLVCTNPALEYMAFIMRMEIFNKEDYECDPVGDIHTIIENGGGHITINGIEIPVDYIDDGDKFFVLENDETIAESEEGRPYIITFQGVGDYLESFEFAKIQAKIFISGSELANALTIDLTQLKPDGSEVTIQDGQITKGASGIKDLDEYPYTEPPEGGAELKINDVINAGGNLALLYKIYIPRGTEIELEWLNHSHTIVAEIIIWLPMVFDSKAENAMIIFPDSFDGISEAIKSFAGIGVIQNMDMKIGINPLNPFGNGILIMRDDNYGDIKNPLDDHNLYFSFSNEDLDFINNNDFNPRFFILYPNKNSILEIPRGDILISTFTLNARIKYNMEL